MPDWKRYIRERLSLPRLRPEREAEIIEDLAQQMEEAYRAARERGASAEEAEITVRGEIQDWNRLARDIMDSQTRDRLPIEQRALHLLEQAVPASPSHASASGRSRSTSKPRFLRFASEFAADILHGLRLLKKRPGFTLAVVVTLALGIGANSAVFTILNAILLRPLPYADQDRLVVIWDSLPSRGWTEFAVSGPNFLDYREQGGDAFERVAAAVNWPANLTGHGEAERISGRAVSHDFLSLLGVRPILGRDFLPEEDKPGEGERVVLLSHGMWQRRFGEDPNILGKAIQLNDVPYTVIGVLPEFYWGRADLFVPLRADPNSERDNHLYSVFGKMKPGVTIEQARATLGGVAKRLADQYPASNNGWTITINPFFDWVVPQDSRRALYLLLGAVALVLLIACANVASLLLARASSRRREIAIRAAIGASRGRLVRQLLAEAVLLAGLGGGLGLLCARWGLSALAGTAATALPRGDEISLDTNVLLFTLGVSLLTGLLFGLAPALQATRVDFHATLKEGAGGGVARQRARSALVIAEVALSLVLLVGVGLLVRSLSALLDVPSGFQPGKLLTASLNLPRTRYPKATDHQTFHNRLLEQLRASPGIASASISSGLPMDGTGTMMEVHPEGVPAPKEGPAPSAQWRLVSTGYFRTMGIPLRGRDIVDTDVALDTGEFRAAVISETLAQQCWPGQDPIGRRFYPWSPTNPPITVVGVVGDVKIFSLDEKPVPAVYLSYMAAWNPIQLVVRTQGDPASAASLVRREVAGIDPSIPVADLRTMEELIDRTTSSRRFTMMLLAIFAGGAVFLAGVGIFGLLAFLVSQWTHDIGIRLALGARRPDILRLVVGRAMVLTSVGIGVGVVVSLALARTIRSLLFGVGARDPLTLATTVVLLLLVSLLACWIPARRAVRIDPLVALRYE